MPSLNRFTSFALGFYSLMLAIALGVGTYRGHVPLWIRWDTLAQDALLGVGSGLVIVVLSRMMGRIKSFEALLNDFSRLLAGLTTLDVFLCALSSSIGEELFFRGLLQPEVGLPVATLLFGLLHIGGERRYLWWTGFALVVGLIFGLMASLRGSLVAPVLAHFVVNLLNLYFLSRRLPTEPPAESL